MTWFCDQLAETDLIETLVDLSWSKLDNYNTKRV